MADPKMNAKWWKDNKAKTLTDSGDSVLKALEQWDKVKGAGKEKVDVRDLETAAAFLRQMCEALKAKANKTAHGDTIKYLEKYVENCKSAQERLKNVQTEAKGLLANAMNLPKPFMAHFKEVAPQQYTLLDENVEFLKALTGKKATADVVKNYIDPKSDRAVNIADDLRRKVIAAAAQGQWEGGPWVDAIEEVKTMLKSALASGPVQLGFVKAALLSQIEMLKAM